MKKYTKHSPISILIMCLAISLLVISCSIAYYFVIYIPKRDSDKIKFTQEQIIQKQKSDEEAKTNANTEYIKCLADAKEKEHNSWINACKFKGISVTKDSNGNENCLLPDTNGDKLRDGYDKNVKICENLYLK